MAGATEAFSSAGSSIAIANTLPATKDEAGYTAVGMVYTDIGEVTDIPEFGPEYSLITHNPLKDRITRKLKGTINYGSLTLNAAMVPGDAGHVKVQTGLDSDASQTFRVTYQDGTEEYFTAKVMTYKRNIGSVDAITACSIGVEIDSPIVTVEA